MLKQHKEEALIEYDKGHTFYAIALQLEQWYHKVYTEKQIEKALGLPNNPVGHEKFRR